MATCLLSDSYVSKSLSAALPLSTSAILYARLWTSARPELSPRPPVGGKSARHPRPCSISTSSDNSQLSLTRRRFQVGTTLQLYDSVTMDDNYGSEKGSRLPMHSSRLFDTTLDSNSRLDFALAVVLISAHDVIFSRVQLTSKLLISTESPDKS